MFGKRWLITRFCRAGSTQELGQRVETGEEMATETSFSFSSRPMTDPEMDKFSTYTSMLLYTIDKNVYPSIWTFGIIKHKVYKTYGINIREELHNYIRIT